MLGVPSVFAALEVRTDTRRGSGRCQRSSRARRSSVRMAQGCDVLEACAVPRTNDHKYALRRARLGANGDYNARNALVDAIAPTTRSKTVMLARKAGGQDLSRASRSCAVGIGASGRNASIRRIEVIKRRGVLAAEVAGSRGRNRRMRADSRPAIGWRAEGIPGFDHCGPDRGNARLRIPLVRRSGARRRWRMRTCSRHCGCADVSRCRRFQPAQHSGSQEPYNSLRHHRQRDHGSARGRRQVSREWARQNARARRARRLSLRGQNGARSGSARGNRTAQAHVVVGRGPYTQVCATTHDGGGRRRNPT